MYCFHNEDSISLDSSSYHLPCNIIDQIVNITKSTILLYKYSYITIGCSISLFTFVALYSKFSFDSCSKVCTSSLSTYNVALPV